MQDGLAGLLKAGAADLMQTLGAPGSVSRSGIVIFSGSLALVETGAQFQAEYGGAVYTVQAVAQIRVSDCSRRPAAGDRLVCNGSSFLVVECNASPFDNCFHLSLSTV